MWSASLWRWSATCSMRTRASDHRSCTNQGGPGPLLGPGKARILRDRPDWALSEFRSHYGKQSITKLDWRVEKMRLSKDKSQLAYNGFLTLSGIPVEVYEYRLGSRSALEWVVDQYQVTTDKGSGIVNDPNREDDPEYIVGQVGQVVTVSLETVRLVKELAGLVLHPSDEDLSSGTPGLVVGAAVKPS